jgi:hypothetical protein
MATGYTESVKRLFIVQAKQSRCGDHCAEWPADTVAMKSPFSRRRAHRQEQAVHHVASSHDGAKHIFAAGGFFF